MKTTAMSRALRSRMIANSAAVSLASRLAVGSSSTSTRVSSSSARAIATSCCTATEKDPSGRSMSMSTPSRASLARACSRALRHEIMPKRPAVRSSAMFLVTDMVGIRLTSW